MKRCLLVLVTGLGVPSILYAQATSSSAGPTRYRLGDCELDVTSPVEIGRAKGHFWFAGLHPVHDKEVLCGVVLADDKAQGKWPGALCLSRDGGLSWRKVRNIDSCGPVSTPLGPHRILMMPYELWPASPGDKRNALADGTIISVSDDGGVTTTPAPIKYRNFPRDLADYNKDELYLLTNGNILRLRTGRLFATVYGKFAGDTKDSTWSVTSDDGGLSWQFQATVATGEAMSHAPEGANESNTVPVADGRLLCVCRTGAEYLKSYSPNDGATWSKPERMDGMRSVEPQLVRFANGVMLLTGGRPGLFLWACTDGEGKKWERLNLAEHHNAHVRDKALRYCDAFCKADPNVQPPQSTSYTSMVAVGPGEALLAYDRLGNGWSGAPGPWGECDVVFCVRIKAVERQPK